MSGAQRFEYQMLGILEEAKLMATSSNATAQNAALDTLIEWDRMLTRLQAATRNTYVAVGRILPQSALYETPALARAA